jgi:hypothetical protein
VVSNYPLILSIFIEGPPFLIQPEGEFPAFTRPPWRRQITDAHHQRCLIWLVRDVAPTTARRPAPSNCAVHLPHGTPGRTRRVRGAIQALELFRQNVLQDVFVQTQVRNQLFQLSVFVLKLLQAPQFTNPETAVRLLPAVERLLRNPICRMTSATGVPVSACFSAKAICSSVYLDFFISSFLPEGFSRLENSRSKWTKKQRGRQNNDCVGRYGPITDRKHT